MYHPRRTFLEMTYGPGPQSREEFYEWFTNILVFADEEFALETWTKVREKRREGKLAEFLSPIRYKGRGRPKGPGQKFLAEGIYALIARTMCDLSLKEILFRLDKIKQLSGRGSGPTPSQYRDLRERMAAAKDWILKAPKDEQPGWVQLITHVESMSPAERKTWVVDVFRKLKAL